MFLIIFIKFYTFLTNYLLAYKQHLKRHHFGQDIEFAAKILYQTDKTCQKPKKNAKKCHLLKLTLLFRCKNKHKMIFLHKSKLFDQISCVCAFFVVPLQCIQCKGSRWDSCTVPLLWFAIRCSNSYKSLVLSELGRLNKRSDKSEDLLRAVNCVSWNSFKVSELKLKQPFRAWNIETL